VEKWSGEGGAASHESCDRHNLFAYTFDEDILKFDSAVADKTDVSHLTRSDLGLAEVNLGAKV
jgi:hypothetical protein